MAQGVRWGYPVAPSAVLLKAFSPRMGDTGGVMWVVADKLDECVVLPPAGGVAAATAGVGAVRDLVFLSRYMRPEGPWQRLRRCLLQRR